MPIPRPPIAPRTRTRSVRPSAGPRAVRTYDNSRSRWSHRAGTSAEIGALRWRRSGSSTERRCISMRRSRRCRAPRAQTGQVEVTSELPVDAGQQVAIEHRRHAERVVVGGNELGQGFFQIRAEQQRIARSSAWRILRRKSSPGARSKLPIELPRKSTTTALAASAASHRPAQAIQVLGLESQNADLGKSSSSRSQLSRAVEEISMGQYVVG